MGYEPYASASYYMDEYGGESLPREARQMWLKRASRHIDSLTFNRITGQGFAAGSYDPAAEKGRTPKRLL